MPAEKLPWQKSSWPVTVGWCFLAIFTITPFGLLIAAVVTFASRLLGPVRQRKFAFIIAAVAAAIVLGLPTISTFI